MWASQVEALEAAGHRVTAPDLPGYGETRARAGNDRLRRPCRRACSTAPAAVVGCSFGGLIALELAVGRPELVERLVLVGSSIGGWDWSEAALAGFAEEEAALERGDLAGAAAQQARMWLAEDADPAVRELTEAMTASAPTSCSCRVEDHVQASWPEPRAAERLADVGVPTLVIVGTEDADDIQAIGREARRGDSRGASSRRSRAPAICRASSGRTSSTGCCSTSFAEDRVREGGPRRQRPVVELAVGEHDERRAPAPGRPRGTSPRRRSGRRCAASRASRVQWLGLRVLELEAEAPVERVEAAEARQDAGEAREGDRRRLGQRLGRDERRRQKLAREAGGIVASVPCTSRCAATRAAPLPSRAGRRRPRRGSARTASRRAPRRGRRAPRSPGWSRSAARPAGAIGGPGVEWQPARVGEQMPDRRALRPRRLVEVDDALLDRDERRERGRELRHRGPAEDVLDGTVSRDDSRRAAQRPPRRARAPHRRSGEARPRRAILGVVERRLIPGHSPYEPVVGLLAGGRARRPTCTCPARRRSREGDPPTAPTSRRGCASRSSAARSARRVRASRTSSERAST